MPWTGPHDGARQLGPDRPIGRVADGACVPRAPARSPERASQPGRIIAERGQQFQRRIEEHGLVGAHVAAVIDAEPGKRPPALCCIRGLGVANDGADPLPWVQVQPNRRQMPERQGGRGVNLVLAGCAADRLGD